MKLDKYVKIVGTITLLIGLALLAVSIYSLIYVTSLKDKKPPVTNRTEITKWIISTSLGIIIGVTQTILSTLMFFADTGHTNIQTPFYFLMGEIVLIFGGLIVFIVGLAFEINTYPANGEAFVGVAGVSWIWVLLALGWLSYKMSKSKIFRVAGRSMA